jgi:hypothetical protein
MKFAEAAAYLAERLRLPDMLIRAGISRLVERTDRNCAGGRVRARYG